jgi:DnaJ-domain-containing protein 1
MTLAELMRLQGECRSDDASLRILEAYLDRVHGAAWRADQAQQESGAGGGATPPGRAMTRAEAYAILGLETGADDQAVKSAHRHLMASFHPDRGGSDYLAALINRARDLLLGR